MEVKAWDAVFIRARRVDVHAVLRDVPAYGSWWPGATSRPLAGAAAGPMAASAGPMAASAGPMAGSHEPRAGSAAPPLASAGRAPGPAGPAVDLRLHPPGLVGRTQRLQVRVTKERPGLGLYLSVTGDARGQAEWYYLDERAGVVVHYLASLVVGDRGARRWLAQHRAAVRAGLHELKDRLEGARLPGAEPDPQLLIDQAAAIAQFNAQVRAGARAAQSSSRGSA